MCPFWITISRWRACASQPLTPLLPTTTQNWPSLTDAVPVAGALNEVFQGRYLAPSKLLFLSRSFPVSLGTLIPGEPLVGVAFQSDTGAGAAAGVAGAGVAACGGVAGVAGAIMADEAGSHPAADATASAAKQNPSARAAVARRRTIISSIFRTSGESNRHGAGRETLLRKRCPWKLDARFSTRRGRAPQAIGRSIDREVG